MIGLLQRVTTASVAIHGQEVARIDAGLLVLIGIRPSDDEAAADRLVERLLKYRVLADESRKMNRSLQDIAGGLLLVPQFTLAADTGRGLRPGFSPAAAPEAARRLFENALQAAQARHTNVQSGIFGADMQIHLVNDGPVTLWLEG